jgi:hypothetical protein
MIQGGVVKLTNIDRDLIELAISNLEKQGGVQHYADAVRNLLAYVESLPAPKIKPWLDEDLIEQIVKFLYPPREDWDEETKARHRSHLKIALTLNHEVLQEDVKRIFEKVENANIPSLAYHS